MVVGVAQPLTSAQLVAARIVGRDEEVLTRTPIGERNDAVHDLGALGTLGVLEFCLWCFALTSFGVPIIAAAPVSLLVATIIMQLDVRMTSSDNEPRGVLRSRPFNKSFYGYFAVRLAMCTILAAPAAIAVDLAIFRGEALEVMHKDRDTRNKAVYAEYDAKIEEIQRVGLGAVKQTLDGLHDQRAATVRAQQQAQSGVIESQAEARAAKLEVSRQDDGLGDRREGHGVLARDAEMRARLAAEQAKANDDRARTLLDNASQLQQQISSAEASYRAQLLRLQPDINRLLTERDGRLIKETTGPLTVFQGLIKLHDDPVRGVGLTFITLVVWALTMALELSFFLRLLFKPASIYDALLTVQRKLYVAAAAHEFRQQIMGYRRRVPLRIVEVEPSIPLHQ